MDDKNGQLEQRLLKIMFDVLPRLPHDAQERVARVAAAYCGQTHTSNSRPQPTPTPATGGMSREPRFSGHADLSPKQFIEEKKPSSDIEKVACLAYYLSQYRDQPHFKTVDISKLNTEAAQFKFSNAAKSVNNASWKGLITAAGKGAKQISALGERFVSALPDRDAAKKVLEDLRVRRKRGRSRAAK